MLLVAFALVGGTGCITMSVVNHVQTENHARAVEAERQRTIAGLAPRAAAGDLAAERALAYALLTARDPGQPDVPRALALLSAGAAQGDVQAQAWLGSLLAEGTTLTVVRFVSLPPALRDRARGIALLQQAATRACVIRPVPGMFPIQPAFAAADGLLHDGRAGQAQVWRARSVVHCAVPRADQLGWTIMGNRTTQAERIESMALLSLTGDAAAIAKAAAALPPADAAAAERRAAELRRLVAASERDYPAPPPKETP